MSKAILHTDGGSRGNPGPSGIGATVEIKGKTHEFKKYIGKATNNQAEYQAIILGLEKAVELNVSEAECLLDSELVVKQLNQEYKVKNKDLAPLFVRVWNLKLKFKKVTFKHIYREENKDADRLVNEAIDEGLT
jgi:ribonuclease HI